MSEEKKKQSGKIKDRLSSSGGKAKKKLVIKKKVAPQKKDISEHFRKDQQSPGGRKGSGGGRPAPSGGSARPRPRPQNRDSQGGPGSGGRGGPPRPDAQRPPQGGGRPGGARPAARQGGGGQRRPGGDKPSTIGGATPFDEVLESTRRSPGGHGQRGGGAGAGRTGGGPGGPGGPGGGPGGGGPRTGGGYRGGGGRGHHDRDRRGENQKFFKQQQSKKAPAASSVPKQIEIMESIQVGDLARKLNLKPSEVIGKLMKMGEMVTINKAIDADTATLLAAEYKCEVKVISLYDETIIKEDEDKVEERITRPPVVTIMGHVDHGKTKLLDTIRSANVIDTEAGAITQHIGAYQVQIPQGAITFLDTPGHEAFTAMRARGAAVTDLVILVVAADDGVKQQTKEAITHAREAKVPIIVAVNKVDLPTADVERVKKELSEHGLSPEDWGGDTVFCEISAKQNIGIEHLLEMILLQAELLDLKANADVQAVGRVVEAKIDPGKGPVATVLVQKGTLREGDAYVVGVYSGRVRAMFDDLGRRVKEAGPAMPVEISGIDGVPEAGDPFHAVTDEKFGREVAGKRQHYKQITEAVARQAPSLDKRLKDYLDTQDTKEVRVIIKADVQGSVEAIRDGLLKLSTEDVSVRMIHGATGAITENDVNLAAASEALVIGFQVRATPRALELSEQQRVDIKYYSIIYDVVEDVKNAMEGMLEPDRIEETIGRAEIREVFKISRVGNVAGCMVTQGKIKRNESVRIIRDSVVTHTGKIKALKRHKDDAQEVSEGFECGISFDGFNDFQVGDEIEAFEIKEVARKL